MKKIIFAIVAILFVVEYALWYYTGGLFGLVSYVSWLAWLYFLLVLVFMWFFYGFAFKSLYSVNFLIVFIVSIWIGVSVIGFATKAMKFGSSDGLATTGTASKQTNTVAPAPTLSKAECAANAAKYDGRELMISGDGVKGKVQIQADQSDCTLNAAMVMVLSASLPANSPYSDLVYRYHYNGIFQKQGQARADATGTGVISPVYSNKGALPKIVGDNKAHDFYTQGLQPSDVNIQPTDTFYVEIPYWKHELSDKGYQEIVDMNRYSIIDVKPYIVRTDMGDLGFSFTTDTEKAIPAAAIVKTFNLTFSQ